MTDQSSRIIVICGPTAVGKSRVAVAVAQALGGEIVSADSMQVYRGIPIITDQPPGELLSSVPHHLVASVGLHEEYSAARFVADASTAIEGITERGNLPLVVGGTGLYVRALTGGFSFAGTDSAAREYWERYVADHGSDAAREQLLELDPEAAAAIDGDNPRRLVRALEAAAAGGSVAAERDRLWSSQGSRPISAFVLELPRDQLYESIDRRVDEMLAGGAIEEVRAALAAGVSRTAAQAIGLREIEALLAGEGSLADAAAAIKQKSRNYAKRQLTWMRKMPDIARIDVAGRTVRETAETIIQRFHTKNDTSPD
ncbi:MAG: tRNA (adenosine(37)-N6)-dimethylallyltransferase MiaA [Thermoleophilia bacterium]